MRYDLVHSANRLTPYTFNLLCTAEEEELIKFRILGTTEEVIQSKVKEIVNTLPRPLFQKLHLPTNIYQYCITVAVTINAAPYQEYMLARDEDSFTTRSSKATAIRNIFNADKYLSQSNKLAVYHRG